MSQQKDLETKLVEDPPITIDVMLSTTTMKLSELSKLNAGEVVLLNQKVNEDLTIAFNGKIVGKVELLSVDGNYAIKINEIVGG